ncbi:MAG: hypothetical protein EBT22_05195 [Chloroflexi bacterium]|nr:hypothetical protein [Chloroflexota bacterium]
MPSTPEIVDATVMTGSVGWIQDVLYPWVSPAWLMAFVMIALGLFAFHSVFGSTPSSPSLETYTSSKATPAWLRSSPGRTG